MGDLPPARLEVGRPFIKSGVDYAGPLTIKSWKGRGAKSYKAYIALFVCLTTKAIHLELVSDLTSEGFLAAFRRFVSRRGKVTDLYSDNGTNFVGANAELKLVLKAVISTPSNSHMADILARDGTNWHFIPPSSPHFGGLWEAGVKSTKQHLKRIMGNDLFTFEELNTLLVQIEACLNSRPLTEMSHDPSDLCALTPGHFLIGEPLTAIPEPWLDSKPVSHLARWKFLQGKLQHFWKRWQMEYLSRLQQRPKWLQQKANVEVGDLVLLREDNMPPLKWSMARILDCHPGDDGLVRVVTVRTANGLLKRPISKISPLPTSKST